MSDTQAYMPTVQMPVLSVAEIQDSLLVVLNDLKRLDGLVSHAATNLLERFSEANVGVQSLLSRHVGDELAAVQQQLHKAVIELQFQDMASQLIGHTSRVIQGCADRLAAEAMERDEDEIQPVIQALPDRPNPVTQDEMDAGSIELF